MVNTDCSAMIQLKMYHAQKMINFFKLEIRNNKLHQLQDMSVKMAANGIRTHARTNQ